MEESDKPERIADWQSIEMDYRTGIKTLRVIASEHGITEGAIRKRAKRDEWERDLAPKIRERADALVRREAVRKEVRESLRVLEKDVVEANAIDQAAVRIAHRRDISRGRELAMRLMGELELQTENRELFEQLGELLYEPDEKGKDKRNELYNKVISMSGRVSNMRTLMESLRIAVALERENWGIDERKKSDDAPTVYNMTF